MPGAFGEKEMTEKTAGKSRKKLIVAIIVIAAVVAAGLFGYFRLQAMIGTTGGETMPDVFVLKKSDLESKVTASGNFSSTDPVSVGSNVLNGEVEAVFVEAGDSVVKGSLLAKLKTSDIERSIDDAKYALSEAARGDRQRKEQAQRSVDDAEADWSASNKQTQDAVDKAQSAYNSAKKKYNNALADDPDDPLLPEIKAARDKAKAELEAAKTQRENTMRGLSSRVTEARATLEGLQGTDSARQQRSQLETLNENLDNASIISPITGIVTRVTTEAGKATMGDMFIIENTESLQISAVVAEYDVIKIEKGMTAHVKSNATGDEVYDGIVDFVAPKASDASGNFEVKVLVTSSVGQLKPGMTATVEVVVESKKDVFAVPIDAVVTRADGKKVVYAYEPAGGQMFFRDASVGEEEEIIFNTEVPKSGPVRVSGSGPGPQTAGGAPIGGGPMLISGGPDGGDSSAGSTGGDRREIEVTTGMETDYYIEIISDELHEGMLILSDPMGRSVGGGFGGFNMMGGPPMSGTATYSASPAGTVTVIEAR